jgi:hypothetical protein
MRRPVRQGVVRAFDVTPRGRDSQFGFRYSGFLKVPTRGVYQFALTSDDGSPLWIDSQVVVDNDGLHGAREKTALVALAPGLHPIQVEFFERDGGFDLKLHWSGPDLPRQPITERDLVIATGNVRYRQSLPGCPPSLADDSRELRRGLAKAPAKWAARRREGRTSHERGSVPHARQTITGSALPLAAPAGAASFAPRHSSSQV